MIDEQIIQEWVLSSKSREQEKKKGIYSFYVHPKANKYQIKQAIENLYLVKVKKIRVCRQKPVKQKTSLLRKFPGKFSTSLRKKAFIELFSGYRLR